jgi:hypothetical protein
MRNPGCAELPVLTGLGRTQHNLMSDAARGKVIGSDSADPQGNSWCCCFEGATA